MTRGRGSAQQWLAKQAGQSWQDILDGMHRKYVEEGRAVVFHCPPEFRVLRRSATGFRGVFVGKGPPDYVAGCGRWSFLLEAKTVDKARFPLELIPDHQAERLTAWEAQHPTKVGALLIRLRRTNVVGWVVPWSEVEARWRGWRFCDGRAPQGTASLNVEVLDRLGVRFGLKGWLDPLLEMLDVR